MEMEVVLPNLKDKKNKDEQIRSFADQLTQIDAQIDFKISARGWAYQLETLRLINKSQFDFIENLINKCRKEGYLPIDFVAVEEARGFSGVEEPDEDSPISKTKRWLEAALTVEEYYTPDWWQGELYYIQMIVEKIDLVSLFKPVCEEYHIPIATSKGWSSMLQRAEYARRFKMAEGNGLKCVLLYCGDHDPDGLKISNFLRKNLRDLEDITWEDGMDGYDPSDLIINRFGLDFDFIEEHGLTWIDNLITGSGKDLASPNHKNYHMDYVQDYLKTYGARKCEANALVPMANIARRLCRDAIEQYLGSDAIDRFEERRQAIFDTMKEFRDRVGLEEPLREAIRIIDEEEE